MQDANRLQCGFFRLAGALELPARLMLQVMEQAQQGGILQVGVMAVQPIEQIFHRQAAGQMRTNSGFVHLLQQGSVIARLILRKGHRLRLVLVRGSHDRPYLIAQLQFETALIAPDGECGLIRRARQCATQAAFAHLPQQQADGTGQCVVLTQLFAQGQQCIGALLRNQPAKAPQLLGLVRHLT